MSVTIRLSWPSNKLSPNKKSKHWGPLYKAKKAYSWECFVMARSQIKAPFPDGTKLNAKIIFQPPAKHRHDTDNLVARAKSGIDGVAKAVGVDDGDWNMTFDRLPPQKPGHVIIELEPVE